MNFEYDCNKEKCWFKAVCKYSDKSYCKEHLCPLHHKMSYLCYYSLLSEKDKYPISLIPDADGTDLDKFIQLKEIQKNIFNFVNKGQNLLLYSANTGNGKTAWAKKLLLSYLNSIVLTSDYIPRCLFISVPKFLNELKENINKPSDYITYIKENINTVDLIIWDEIGVKNLSPWEHDLLFSYINNRIENGKSNIYTSNLVPEQLKQILGDRIYSRIIQLSTLIQFNGKDKRALMKGDN